MKNSDCCYFHDKQMRTQRAQSTSKGGKTPKKVFKPLPLVKITDSKGVVELLTTTINEIRNGDIDVRIANCLGFLSSHLLKALEISEFEERLEKIEKVILEKRTFN